MLLPTSWSLGCHDDVQVAVMRPPAGEEAVTMRSSLGGLWLWSALIRKLASQLVKHPGQGLPYVISIIITRHNWDQVETKS